MEIALSESANIDRNAVRFLVPRAISVVHHSISKEKFPEIAREVQEFSEDRGGVHQIFWSYMSGREIEPVLLEYWNSRSDAESFRIESSLTGILLNLALSVVACALYDVGKPIVLQLKQNMGADFFKRLRDRANADAISLHTLLAFRNHIYASPGATDRDEFRKLLAYLGQGGTLKAYCERHAEIVKISPPHLDYFVTIAKGLDWEPSPPLTALAPNWDKIIEGFALSDFSGFGIVRDFTSRGQLGGKAGRDELIEHATRVLDEPAHELQDPQSRLATKSVILTDGRIMDILLQDLGPASLKKISGFVTAVGGHTSHSSVWARNTRRAAMLMQFVDTDVQYRYAAITPGKIMLKNTFPAAHSDEISRVMSYQSEMDGFVTPMRRK